MKREYAINAAQAGKREDQETSSWDRERATGIGYFLERLGFQKYILAGLFTVLAFGMTVGAFVFESNGGLDDGGILGPKVKAIPNAADVLKNEVRGTVNKAFRYAGNRYVADRSQGIKIFDISGLDNLETAKVKLSARGLRLMRKETDECRFAYLAGADAFRDEEAVARIYVKNEACCDLTGDVGKQLDVYNFEPETPGAGEAKDSVRGALVFSGVSGELLAVYVKVRQFKQSSFEAAAKRMIDEYGNPVKANADASYWEKNGSLLSLSTGGGDVAVSILHEENIDRHAERLMSLVEERRERFRDAGKMLAEAGAIE